MRGTSAKRPPRDHTQPHKTDML